MNPLRNHIEVLFSRLGYWICNHRFLVLFIVTVVTMGMLAKIDRLSVDTSNDALYHPDDPVMLAYNEFRDRFGKDDHIIIGIASNNIFSADFLRNLQKFQKAIVDKVPHLKDVTSLLNVRNTFGKGDELVVENLIAEIPATTAAMNLLRKKILANPFYLNYLISEDGSFTVLDIEPVAVVVDKDNVAADSSSYHYLSTKEYSEMMAVLDPLVTQFEHTDFVIYSGGMPVITDRLTKAVEKYVAQLVPLGFLINILFLTLLFRRVSGVIYPVLIVMLSIIGTIGIQAWIGLPINMVTSILPTFLIVVGVADSVHILSAFYREYQKNEFNKHDAIALALKNNGLAILMTSVTTAIGLMSFMQADIGIVAQLGAIAPIGIMLAFIYTVLLLPALIAIFPMRESKTKILKYDYMDKMLNWIAEFSCHHYKVILIISIGLFVFAVAGIMQLAISHNTLYWFPQDSSVRNAASTIDHKMGGSVPLEVVIDTGKPKGLYDPELMRQLDQSINVVQGLGTETIKIGNAYTISVILKEVNRALHTNREEFYVVPNSKELTAQELLLFELSEADDLNRLVAKDYSMVRFTILVPFIDSIKMKPILGKIRQHFQTTYPQAQIITTGVGPMLVETMYDMLSSMLKSYTFALIVITVLMVLLIGQLRIGLVSMIPNLLPIMLVMGIMGWMGLPFDFSNMLAGSIVIGLVVDDTIHFLHNFRRNFEILGNVKIAIKMTLQSTGRAIFITSAVLAAGMALNLVADLRSMSNFGTIASSAVVLALLADYFLAPALMIALHGGLSSKVSDGDGTGLIK